MIYMNDRCIRSILSSSTKYLIPFLKTFDVIIKISTLQQISYFVNINNVL